MGQYYVSRYINMFPTRAMESTCLVGKRKKKKRRRRNLDRIGAASWPASDLGPPAPAFFGAFDHLSSQHSRIVVSPEAIAENTGLGEDIWKKS